MYNIYITMLICKMNRLCTGTFRFTLAVNMSSDFIMKFSILLSLVFLGIYLQRYCMLEEFVQRVTVYVYRRMQML